MPLIKIWGNSQLVARLPSIIAGLLTILIISLITWELTEKREIAVAAGVLLLTCLWHIVASRMVWEANLALFWLALAIWLCLRQKFWMAAFPLVLSVYGYHSQWVLVPLLALLMKLFYFKKRLGWFWLGVIGLSCLPLLVDYVSNAGPGARANSEVFWHEAGFVFSLKNVMGQFFKNYWQYFNPVYLFFDGLGLLAPKNPFRPGLFLWPMLIPLIVGLTRLKKVIKGRHWQFFLIWWLISPLAGALTHGEPNLIRNLNSVLPWVIIMAVGIREVRWWWQMLGVVVLLQFLIIYFFIYPVEMAKSFQGYRPIAEYLAGIEDEATDIFVDYRYGSYRWGQGVEYFGVPHLYLGFFNYWNPEVIQNRRYTPQGVKYGKYLVGQVDWNQDIFLPGRYFVVSVGNPPEEYVKDKLAQVATFEDAAGQIAFEVWKVR